MASRTLNNIICVVAMLVSLHEAAWGEYRYRLHLDGKPESQYVTLSERAQQRREQQGIALDSTDLEVSPLYLDALKADGLQVLTQSHWLNSVVVMSPDGTAIDEERLWSFGFVTRIDTLTTTQRASARRRFEPTDDAGSGTGVIPAGDNCTTPLRQVNAYKSLYEAGYRGAGKLVAILDAGFLDVNRWSWLLDRVIGTRDLYARTEAESQIYTSDSHGTCCYSIMVTPKSHGVCGTAQEADYYLIRTETVESESSLEEDMWVAGAELADSIGADVISSSLGYYEFDKGLVSHTQDEFGQGTAQISRGAEVACHKGMLVCNAAGNEGTNAWKRLLFPADVEEVLTVGGVNSNGAVTSFSSRGFTVPYVKPDVLARASQCYTINLNSPTGGATSSGAGTSYATPLMAGLCTSLWSAVPELTPAQIRDAVRQSASYSEHPDSIHGYGIPDFAEALRLAREWTGHVEEGISTIDADSHPHDAMRYTISGQPVGVDDRRGLTIENGRVVFRREE